MNRARNSDVANPEPAVILQTAVTVVENIPEIPTALGSRYEARESRKMSNG